MKDFGYCKSIFADELHACSITTPAFYKEFIPNETKEMRRAFLECKNSLHTNPREIKINWI